MAAGFVLALLLCSGDNCDLVRLDPATSYGTYEACRDASQRDAARIGEIARRYREPDRDGDVICLRDRTEEGSAQAPQPKRATGGAMEATMPLAKPSAKKSEDEKTAAAAATPPPQSSPRPPVAHEFRDCDQCPVMVALPRGQFTMGSSADPTERPQHAVTIAAFALGKFEVTEREWGACVAAGNCRYKGEGQSPDLPMRNLSWDDATEFVRWLKSATGRPYRLPSEAEWEYAARAGTTTPYPWGASVGVGQADCKGCGGRTGGAQPAGVSAFPASAWGLYGLLGGVAEWTADCWHATYAGAPGNGAAWSAPNCRAHVLRGGSWMNPPSDITVSSRNFYDSSVRYEANGMRVALPLE
jgi:formylglycine-generating enzyme required for sulfatase activity